MKLAFPIIAAGLSALFLASCITSGTASNSGGRSSPTGPFDKNGNYVEEWADSPSKWKGGSAPISKPGESMGLPNDVPSDSVPIPTAGNTREPAPITSGPVVSRTKTSTVSNSKPVKGKATASKTSTGKATASKTTPERTVKKPEPEVVSKGKKKTPTAGTKTKTPVASTKTAAKKPTSASHYTIKKGDTLSAIASRNHTSVSALQKANGISGAMIQPGKSLVIPK